MHVGFLRWVASSKKRKEKKIWLQWVFFLPKVWEWIQWTKQGITNRLALPIEKMLYIYLLCPPSEHQKNPFWSKQSKQFHQRNQFALSMWGQGPTNKQCCPRLFMIGWQCICKKGERIFNTLLSPTPTTHSPHCLVVASDTPSTTAVGFLASNLHRARITMTTMLDIMLAKIYIKRPQCSKSPFCWWLGVAVPGKKEINKPKTSKYLCLLLCVCCISGWPTRKKKILHFKNKSSNFPLNWTFMMGKGETKQKTRSGHPNGPIN